MAKNADGPKHGTRTGWLFEMGGGVAPPKGKLWKRIRVNRKRREDEDLARQKAERETGQRNVKTSQQSAVDRELARNPYWRRI